MMMVLKLLLDVKTPSAFAQAHLLYIVEIKVKKSLALEKVKLLNCVQHIIKSYQKPFHIPPYMTSRYPLLTHLC